MVRDVLKVSSLKEKIENQTSKSSKQIYLLLLKLLLRSCINSSHLRKINWLLANDRVEYCTANTISKYWNGTVSGYIHEMYKISLCRYNIKSQVALDIPLQKSNKEQKSLYFLGLKI